MFHSKKEGKWGVKTILFTQVGTHLIDLLIYLYRALFEEDDEGFCVETETKHTKRKELRVQYPSNQRILWGVEEQQAQDDEILPIWFYNRDRSVCLM